MTSVPEVEFQGRSDVPYEKNKMIGRDDDEELVNDNPIEEVRLTVPITDDPTEPVLTFRTWVLGIASCVVLAFVNQFFAYRTNQLSVTSVSAQIVVLPIGRLMAATLPTTRIRVPLTGWSFTLNPGPFSMKEHALITIFAGCGANGVYAVYILTAMKAFYKRPLNTAAAMLLVQTTQLLGYGWGGLFRKYLVDSPYMWWPYNLVQVSLFRALHEKERRPKGGVTRFQFFTIVFVASFAYYIVPGYLFPTISAFSVACWIWKKSITAQQIGSGMNGLGVGSFGLDWSTVAFLGSPLATPFQAIANFMVGFFVFIYVIIPTLYWTNTYDAKKFPLISSHTFDDTGKVYNISRILNDKVFDINIEAYNNYSKLHLSMPFALLYGFSFATLAATISHVALFEGSSIWQMWKKASSGLNDKFQDVHTRIMKKNYREVPQWWFVVVLVISTALALAALEGFDKQLQLPWWGLALACFIAFLFTLPIGVIQATTNTQLGLNVITELIIGYMYPGKPLANVTFKTYGHISMLQALTFVQDFKLGHYMKIPPRSMFIVQLVGTLVASTTCFGTAWFLLRSIENICHPDLLPEGSQWTCPGYDVFYNASIIWGVIGPLRMFTKQGLYPELNYFFLMGALAPFLVWYFSRKFPQKKWIKLINFPVIFFATQWIPPAKPVHFLMWGTVGFVFNYYIYNKYKRWWARHNYIISGALDAGLAFMAILIFFALQYYNNISGPTWWGSNSDIGWCSLGSCPTDPSVINPKCQGASI